MKDPTRRVIADRIAELDQMIDYYVSGPNLPIPAEEFKGLLADARELRDILQSDLDESQSHPTTPWPKLVVLERNDILRGQVGTVIIAADSIEAIDAMYDQHGQPDGSVVITHTNNRYHVKASPDQIAQDLVNIAKREAAESKQANGK